MDTLNRILNYVQLSQRKEGKENRGIKIRVCQMDINGLRKNKNMRLYAVYKKPTSNIMI